MSDHNTDGKIDKSDDHSGASLVPKSGDMAAGLQSEPKQIAAPFQDSSKGAPKDIVLQRLTPHSSWDNPAFNTKASDEPFGPEMPTPGKTERRALSLAAIVALAAAVGAVGGSAATFGIGHYVSSGQTVDVAAQGHAMDGAIAKVNAEITSLKALATAQSAKLAKLSDTTTKLSDAGDKARTAPEITGSITPPAAATANRLPIVDGWALRDVGEGAARVEGRLGVYEVYPGDSLPGIGRVDAIRRQDGRWVVVTSRGLIVER